MPRGPGDLSAVTIIWSTCTRRQLTSGSVSGTMKNSRMDPLRTQQSLVGWLLLALLVIGPTAVVMDALTSETAMPATASDKDCCSAAHPGRVCPMRHAGHAARPSSCRVTCGRRDPELWTLLMPGVPGPGVSGITPPNHAVQPIAVGQPHVLIVDRTPEFPPPRPA